MTMLYSHDVRMPAAARRMTPGAGVSGSVPCSGPFTARSPPRRSIACATNCCCIAAMRIGRG